MAHDRHDHHAPHPPHLHGPMQPPAAGGEPRALVVLLHGLGADGSDLIGLAEAWAPHLPHALFVAPDAPFPCDFAPQGRQWFAIRDMDGAEVQAGVEAATPILDHFIDEALAALGLPDSALALVGFSQGAMLALHAGLRRRSAPAAVISFAGMMAAHDNGPITARPPVLLVHGDEDQVVPPAFMPIAKGILTSHQVPVEAHVRQRLGHGIDAGAVALATHHLTRYLTSALAAVPSTPTKA